MYSDKMLKKGKIVWIINEESPLYGEFGEISWVEKSGNYRIKTAGGGEFLIHAHECVPWLGMQKERELHQAHLIQMQHLAVDTGDKRWFEELAEIRKDLESSG